MKISSFLWLMASFKFKTRSIYCCVLTIANPMTMMIIIIIITKQLPSASKSFLLLLLSIASDSYHPIRLFSQIESASNDSCFGLPLRNLPSPCNRNDRFEWLWPERRGWIDKRETRWWRNTSLSTTSRSRSSCIEIEGSRKIWTPASSLLYSLRSKSRQGCPVHEHR